MNESENLDKAQLMKIARQKGICADGYKLMHSYDREDLLDYYMQHPDWCMERDYPPLHILRQQCANTECQECGIYIDHTFHGETLSELQTYIFHNCRGVINVAMDYDNANIPMLYFANDCHMTVQCEQENSPAIRVPLYVFGENRVTCASNDNATFRVYEIELLI